MSTSLWKNCFAPKAADHIASGIYATAWAPLQLRQLDGVAAGGGAQRKVNLVTPLALSAHCLLQFSSNHTELTAAPKAPNKHI